MSVFPRGVEERELEGDDGSWISKFFRAFQRLFDDEVSQTTRQSSDVSRGAYFDMLLE